MELRHLRYFVTLAETLHFARAAAQLNIVQPALSMQIKALEEDLGVALLTRTKRKVELTQAGKLFLVDAKRTLQQAERARETAQAVRDGAIGRVRLGFSASAVYSGIFTDLVRTVRRERPDIVIDIQECHPTRIFDLLSHDQIDVAFGTLFSQTIPAHCACRIIATYPPRLVLPRDHRLAGRDSICRAELKEEAFIGYSGPDVDDGLGLTRKVLGLKPRTACQVSTPAMAVAMVATGLGLAVVPESLAVPNKDLVFKPISDNEDEIDVSAIYRKEERDGAVLGFLSSMTRRLEDAEGPFGNWR